MTILFMLNACGSDDSTAPASYKITSSKEQVARSLLSSIKTAVSRNSPQDALRLVIQNLANYKFTDNGGNLVLPPEVTTTLCAEQNLNISGKLTRVGDIQIGSLTYTDYCLSVPNNNNVLVPLVANGTIDYETDINARQLQLHIDITASLDFDQYLYAGSIMLDLDRLDNIDLVNQYQDSDGTVYYTDALGVSGNIDQGYRVNGSIRIGDKGTVRIQTSLPILYGATCAGSPEQGKLEVTTADTYFTLEIQPPLCQLQLCSTPESAESAACKFI